MKPAGSTYKLIYTFFLVVIYLIFFTVHCFFKTYYGADAIHYSGTTITSISKEKNNASLSQNIGHQQKSKPCRLNKRFHPGDGFIIPVSIQIEQPSFTVIALVKIVYENPTIAQVCLSRSLRAPPAAIMS